VLALRYADGVVMAGDRQATEGHLVAHKTSRRCSRPTASRRWPSPAPPAWPSRWCACSRSSWSTTRRSKAPGCPRRQGQLPRPPGPQPAPDGVPGPGGGALFAGYDELTGGPPLLLRRGRGPVRGAGLRQPPARDPASPSRISARLPPRPDPRGGLGMAVEALVAAAQEDTATGGPTCAAASSPTWFAIDADGVDEVSDEGPIRAAPWTPSRHPMSIPFYVAPEQLVRDKAEFARKGIARGRSIVALEFDPGSCCWPRTRRGPSRRSPRSTTGSPSPASASTTSSRPCARPGSARPT
jgi:hypothetical protein